MGGSVNGVSELDFNPVLFDSCWIGAVLWFFGCGMLKLVEGVVDVAGHTEIACAIEIIPVEVDATEAFAGPVDVDFFVMVAEALDEVVSMFSAHIIYAKIVDDEAECDRSPLMAPQSRCVGDRGIAILA